MTNSVTFTAIARADFQGITTAGAVSVPGLKVGDQMMYFNQDGGGFQTPDGQIFEATVSVANEIQQVAHTDYSAHAFTILFFRAV